VTFGSWDGEKVILRDQVLEVRPSSTPGWPAGSHKPDEWDPPIERYEPYGRMVKPSARNQSGSPGPLACRAVRQEALLGHGYEIKVTSASDAWACGL